MSVTVTLVAGLGTDTPGSELSLDDVAFRFPSVSLSIPFVLPEVSGQTELNAFLATGFGYTALLHGNWPSPLNQLDLINPTKVTSWINGARGVEVDKILITHSDWIAEVVFNGDGPTAAEILGGWSESELLDLTPIVNGVQWNNDGEVEPEPEPEPAFPGLMLTAEGRDPVQYEGSDLSDSLKGGWGDDTLNGNDGGDLIEGYVGSNRLSGGKGHDTITGGGAQDTILGGTGNDFIRDGYGDDMVRAGSGSDTLAGGYGDDTLKGGSGSDVFYDNHGADRMFGQGGADTFVFVEGDGGWNSVDTIFGYSASKDRILGETSGRLEADGIEAGQYTGLELRDVLRELDVDITFRKRKVLIEDSFQGVIEVKMAEATTQSDFWASLEWNIFEA